MSLTLLGCCPSGELRQVQPEAPSSGVQLAFYWDGERVAGPGDCGGYWAVDDVEGGSEVLGFIDDCGRYTPPEAPRAVTIMAATDRPGECADCCPYATRALKPSEEGAP